MWLQVASVPDLEPFVLFMDGKPGEKRYLANADDIIRQLQRTFPGMCPTSTSGHRTVTRCRHKHR